MSVESWCYASPTFPPIRNMADEEENLVDYEEEALDEKADGGDEKEIKKYVVCVRRKVCGGPL